MVEPGLTCGHVAYLLYSDLQPRKLMFSRASE